MTQKEKDTILNAVIRQGKADMAAHKAKEAAKAKAAKEEAARRSKLQKLHGADPYNVVCTDGHYHERQVNILITMADGMKILGRLTGNASIQMPAARKWAAYCSKQHHGEVALVDFNSMERFTEYYSGGIKVREAA